MQEKPKLEVDGVALDDIQLILVDPSVSESVIDSSSGRKNTPIKRVVVDLEACVKKVIRGYDSAEEAEEVYMIAETLARSGIKIPPMRVAGSETEQMLIDGLNLSEICELAETVFSGESRWMYEELSRRAEGYIRGEIRRIDDIKLSGVGEACGYDYSGKFLEAAEGLAGLSKKSLPSGLGLEGILSGLKRLEIGSSERFKDATSNNFVNLMGYLVSSVSERQGGLDPNGMMNELAEELVCRPELAARLGIDAALVRRVVARNYRDSLTDFIDEMIRGQSESMEERHRRIEGYVEDEERAEKDIKRMAYATIFARAAEGTYDFEDVMHMLFEGMFYVDLDGMRQMVYPGTDELHAHRFNQAREGCLYREGSDGMQALNQFYWNVRWAYKTLSTDVKRGLDRLAEIEGSPKEGESLEPERERLIYQIDRSYQHAADCIRGAKDTIWLLPDEMRGEAEALIGSISCKEPEELASMYLG